MKIILHSVEILACIAECAICFHFLIRYLGFKEPKSYLMKVVAIALFILLAIFDIAFSQQKGFELLVLALFFGISFLFSIISLKGSFIEKIFLSIFSVIVLTLSNLLVGNVVAFFLAVDSINRLHTGDYSIALRIALLFITKFIYLLVLKIILSIKKKSTYDLSVIEWSFIIIFFGFSSFICIILWQINRTHTDFDAKSYIAIVIGLIVINILLYYFLNRLGSENRRKAETDLLKSKLDSQRQLTAEIKNQYGEIKILRHDIKHYIYHPLKLLKEGNPEGALTYLEEFYTSKIESIPAGVFTDCELIDAVINSKISLCSKKGITTKCEVISNYFLGMEQDVSVLLANLFDNAIEASDYVMTDKQIILLIKAQKSFLNIEMKNSICTSVLEANPDLNTRKSNKYDHGYGIKSTKSIVRQHNGKINFYEKGGFFIVDIYLRLSN